MWHRGHVTALIFGAGDMTLDAPRKLITEEQRLELLFARYSEMTWEAA